MDVQTDTGPYIELVTAFSPHDRTQSVSFGLGKEFHLQHTRLGLRSAWGQFYGIVRPGMALAQHCFKGLQRPLMRQTDMEADQTVFVYTWKPSHNYEWVGTGNVVQ